MERSEAERRGQRTRRGWIRIPPISQNSGTESDLATPGLGAGEGEDSHVRLRSQGVTRQEVKLLKSRGNIQQ